MLIDPKNKVWAVARVFLGTLQIIAAMTTFLLFLQTGRNWLTEVGLGVTLLLLSVSYVLYGAKGRPPWKRAKNNPALDGSPKP